MCLPCLRSVLETHLGLQQTQGYAPMQKVCLILSSSTSLSMVCMVSRVIIMKGMLWDTAVKDTRRKGIIHFSMWEILTLSCIYTNIPGLNHTQQTDGGQREFCVLALFLPPESLSMFNQGVVGLKESSSYLATYTH